MRFGLKACQNLAVFLCCPSQLSVLNEKIYISGVVPPLLTPPVTDRLINYQKSVCGFLAVVSVYRRCSAAQVHAAPPGDGSWKRKAAFINVWPRCALIGLDRRPVQPPCYRRSAGSSHAFRRPVALLPEGGPLPSGTEMRHNNELNDTYLNCLPLDTYLEHQPVAGDTAWRCRSASRDVMARFPRLLAPVFAGQGAGTSGRRLLPAGRGRPGMTSFFLPCPDLPPPVFPVPAVNPPVVVERTMPAAGCRQVA